ncbi:molybdopterin-dependent oxidoreductase [Fuchsiella alkaliacetigena]|uniref:molybdopterin-dependent oxidoreductase n=1 Tax=Fuchsiella alkaliacetigena TaxID=957042 RepID=UPI00200A2942|nr:molybdopterin-dependent oxidoreductase [Fuchsiella alkaliacetigena]MCK8825009.1 molybdopterin-dependent oxidoreductase [Fuchsiella alkaliacetigena]
MKLSRRDFLKVSAATTGGLAVAGLTGCRDDEPELDSLAEAEEIVAEEDGWYPSTCQGCTTWCAIEVKVVDGRAVNVRGNPNNQAHRGSVCTRCQLALLQVYDPDRVTRPMKRTNPNKGKDEDPEFVEISWDEAIEEITDKIVELRERGETYKSAVFRGRYTALNSILYGNFPTLIGTPNNISHSAICAESEKMGPYYTESYWGYNDCDMPNTKYLLLWGGDILASNRQVPHANKVFGDVIDNATIAQVDPRYSATAAKSDEWLPVIPQEDDALALAMAHVILTKGLWYKEFVGDFTDGQNRFVAGEEVDEDSFDENYTNGVVKWWNLALKDATPEWAEDKAGVAAEQIERVATEFAEAAPHAISWVCPGPTMNPRGSYTSMAIHALNGLVGSSDNKGGVLQDAGVPTQGFPDFDDYLDDELREAGQKQVIDQRGYKDMAALNQATSGGGVVTANVAQAVLDEDPYDLELVLSYWNNFNFSCGDTAKWDKALEKIDMLVHMGTHAAEMSYFADIVLPVPHHMFERWGYINSKANQYMYSTLNQPVIEPVWDVKTEETEVVWMIAEKLAEKGYPEMLDYYKTYEDPETGAAPTNGKEFTFYATRIATEPMWNPDKYEHGTEFDGWEDFVDVGVWNADKYDNFKELWGNYGTDTGLFEFYSETLKRGLQEHADRHNISIDEALEANNYLAKGEEAFVPHYEESYRVGDADEYPLMFVDHKSRFNREGRSANSYIGYYDVKDGDPGDERNKDVVKINPEDANELGISTGDQVRISSPTGEIECEAKVWEGVRPGTVAKSFGQGHWAYGRVASEEFGEKPRGGNNNTILPDEYDRLSGSTARHGGHRVKVEKI